MTLQELNEHFRIRSQLEQLYELRANISSRSLGAQRLDGMPHGTGTADRTAAIAAALADVNARIESQERWLAEREAAVSAYIGTVTDARIQAALRLRFLGGFSWGEVTSFIGQYESEDCVKTAVYRYLRKQQ